jgi:hypothetical protein
VWRVATRTRCSQGKILKHLLHDEVKVERRARNQLGTGMPEIVCLSKKQQLVSRNKGALRPLPSRVRNHMIVQPLVCKHAPKKDKTKQCMDFSGLQGTQVPPFTETKRFQSKACILHRVGSEGDVPIMNRGMNDVPHTQKNSRWLE